MLDLQDSYLFYETADDLRSRDIADLHEYWRAKCGKQSMPRPSDIDPAEIPHLSHSIVLVDYSDPPFRVRYRQIGPTQRHYGGEDFTGCYLDEMAWTEKALVATVHERAFRGRAPVFGSYTWEFRDPLSGFCEFGVFPLAEDGVTVTGGIGFDDYSFFEQQLDRAR